MSLDANKSVYRLRTLKRGERYVYHTGYLPMGRASYPIYERKYTKEEAAVISKIADEALTLSNKRRVHLVQRRLKDFTYDYIALGTTI